MTEIGDVLSGRFTLTSLLGEGGMGAVYLAKDTELGRDVAIKMLLPQLRYDSRGLDELRHEVRLSARLSHHGIVTVHDLRTDESTPYIVMEYLDGIPLSEFIYGQPSHRIDDVQLFRRLAAEVLDAVAYAHGRGVVHRDLKPSNLMVARDGAIKVMDFGIAATLYDTHTRLTGLSSGMTAQYSSPEQIQGASPTPAMDVYSLGCVFYEMLVGQPPFFQGDVLHQHLTTAPPPMKDVEELIERAVLAALSKDPADRPSDAKAFSRSLASPAAVHNADLIAGAPRRSNRVGRVLILAGLTVGLAAGGFYLSEVRGSAARAERPGAVEAMLPQSSKSVDSSAPPPDETDVTATGGAVGQGRETLAVAETRSAEPARERSAAVSDERDRTETATPMTETSGVSRTSPVDVADAVLIARQQAQLARRTEAVEAQERALAARVAVAIADSIARADSIMRVDSIEAARNAWVLQPTDLGEDQFELIPAGTFEMGGPGARDQEPVHRVTITKAFFLQKTEVTQGQWEAVMGANPSLSLDCGESCPVERTSWDDVQEFLARVNRARPGMEYRLPTEAEWEYAARGGVGDSAEAPSVADMGWYKENSGRRAHPVAQRMPNPFGIYDVQGNLWEWVQDRYDADYFSESPDVDPTGPATGGTRVLRGGSWDSPANRSCLACRQASPPDWKGALIGFRLARNGQR